MTAPRAIMDVSVIDVAVSMLWQGTLLVLLWSVAMRLLPLRSAARRHVLWFVVLAATICIPIVATINVQLRSPRNASKRSAIAQRTEFEAPAIFPASYSAPNEVVGPSDAHDVVAAPVGANARSSAVWTFEAPRRAEQLLAITWALVALFMAVRLVRGIFAVHALKKRATALEPDVERALRRHVSVPGDIQLLSSRHIAVPVALGFRANAIVFPTAMLDTLTATQLHHVTLHELAHLVRRDDWTALLLRGVQSILFFAPAVHVAARRIELEQEMACDEWALKRSHATPAAYASSLVRIGELATTAGRSKFHLALLTPSMATQLSSRVNSLLARRKQNKTQSAARSLVAALIVPLPFAATALVSVNYRVIQVLPSRGSIDSARVARKQSIVETIRNQRPSVSVRDSADQTAIVANDSNRVVPQIPQTHATSDPRPSNRTLLPLVSSFAIGTVASNKDRIVDPPALLLPLQTAQASPLQQRDDRKRENDRIVDQRRTVNKGGTSDTSRFVDKRRIVVPHDLPALSAREWNDTLRALANTLHSGDARARARAAYSLSLFRGRSTAVVSSLIAQLYDSTSVTRTDNKTSGAWWNSESIAVTSPSEEAAKALLFIGRTAQTPLQEFSLTAQGVARRRAQWVLGLLARFD